MRFLAIEGIPRLHTVPLTTVRHEQGTVRVEYGDHENYTVCLVFEPMQAYRVTTADCFVIPQGFLPYTVVEVLDSPWIAELKAALRIRHRYATFMEKARHFLIPGGDDFVEIVAWSVRLEEEAAQDLPWEP
jgi:hypothetical protein